MAAEAESGGDVQRVSIAHSNPDEPWSYSYRKPSLGRDPLDAIREMLAHGETLRRRAGPLRPNNISRDPARQEDGHEGQPGTNDAAEHRIAALEQRSHDNRVENCDKAAECRRP